MRPCSWAPCAPAWRSRRSRRARTAASLSRMLRRRGARGCCSSMRPPPKASPSRRHAAHRARRRPAAGRSLDDWLAPEGARPCSASSRSRDSPFNIIYSSGTTGEPKGIVQATACAGRTCGAAHATATAPDTVTLLSTPLYSNTTLVRVLPDARLRRQRGADAQVRRRRATWNSRSSMRVTHTMLVPVQYQRLMAHAGLRRATTCPASSSSSAPARRSMPRSRPTCWRAGPAGWSSSTA